MDEVRQFDIVSAVFQPQRTDDLRPGVEKYIGRRMQFHADFICDTGKHTGEWHMSVMERMPEFCWCPLSDLQDIQQADDEE